MSIKISIIFIILLVLLVQPGYAQDQAPFTANVDRTSLSTGETLILTVTVNVAVSNPPQPTLPALEGFNVVGRGTSSQISIVNGAISAQTVYSYRLQPIQPGNLVIEPISLTVNGQTFTTEPITVQVTQGSGGTYPVPTPEQPAPAPTQLAGQDLFVEAEVDNPTPYIGQQVIYTFRFYRTVNLFNQPRYEAPAFNGFWYEQQPDQARYNVQAAGRLYRVTELRTILFPTTVGAITIEPTRLTVPGSFFQRDTVLQTEPVVLDIKSLPANAPDGFNGAVGQYDLVAEVDTTQSKVNEPVTLQVTLSGQGNLNTVPDPVWPEMPGWRSFESQATINTHFQDGQASGSRIYERLLVPETEGELTIPPIEYIYFDPVAAEYRTITTQPLVVSIAPGAADVPPPPQLIGGNKEFIEQFATDIRHLKPVPSELKLAGPPLTEQNVYWLAWGLPLLALAGHFGWQWRQRRWQNNVSLVRSSRARKMAKKAIAQARKQSATGLHRQDTYAVASRILTTYLGDKLNQPVGGLTQKALVQLLAEEGITLDLIERVKTCLFTTELGRYSPEAQNPVYAKDLLKEIDILIGDLEKAL